MYLDTSGAQPKANEIQVIFRNWGDGEKRDCSTDKNVSHQPTMCPFSKFYIVKKMYH